jgi:pyruvate carboxylase subunit B
MTIYRVSVGNHEYRVEVAGSRLRIDGEQIQANLMALNELGLYLMRRGTQRREIHVSTTRGSNTYTALAEGRHLVAQVERENGRAQPKNNLAAQGDLCAPMPGVVIKILVNLGDTVEKGQAVVVMESMKMQMELRAPLAGQVTQIAVQAMKQVDKAALLVKIAPVAQ